MKTKKTYKEVKELFGKLKNINDNTIRVVVKVVNNKKKVGLWMQYWTYEDIIKGEKIDKLGNKIIFLSKYNH
jgi:hypothetical protein